MNLDSALTSERPALPARSRDCSGRGGGARARFLGEAAVRSREAAFTLIELIIVMSLLVVVASLVAPRLAEFFRGRDISDEVRRFIAVTQYAEQQAVSEGIPMTLWLDPLGSRYGLREADGWARPGVTNHGEIYTLGGNLEFSRDLLQDLTRQGEAQIRFLPDGGIDEGSVSNVFIVNPDRELVWIRRSTNGPGYEVFENRRLN